MLLLHSSSFSSLLDSLHSFLSQRDRDRDRERVEAFEARHAHPKKHNVVVIIVTNVHVTVCVHPHSHTPSRIHGCRNKPYPCTWPVADDPPPLILFHPIRVSPTPSHALNCDVASPPLVKKPHSLPPSSSPSFPIFFFQNIIFFWFVLLRRWIVFFFFLCCFCSREFFFVGPVCRSFIRNISKR